MVKNSYLACLVMLTLAAMGCDDETVPTDAGRDSGPMVDAGSDAGEDAGEDPGVFHIRLAHNVPGLVGITDEVGAADICLWWGEVGGGVVPGTAIFATGATGPVPFRGVTPYQDLTVLAPRGYVAGFYDPSDISGSCPADPYDAAAAPAVLLAEVTADLIPADSYTLAVATGLVPDTLGGTAGALPSICNPAGAPTFMELCTAGTELLLYDDDQAAPATGMTRFRVMNQVVNSTPPSGWTLCYDPGIVPMAPPATGCADITPTADDHEALATAVAYGDVTDYEDRAPIVPTGVPAAGIGGGLYLELEAGTGCPAFTDGDACYPILAAFPPPATGEDPLPEELAPTLADGAINTIFISGLLPPGAPFETDFGVKFLVWHDNYVEP